MILKLKQTVANILPESWLEKWHNLRDRYVLERSGDLKQAYSAWEGEYQVALASLRSLPAFKKLAQQKNIKLHLGCGSDMREGWVNLDFLPQKKVKPPYLVAYDLRRPLPLPDGCCQYIYSSHFFEHLDREDGERLMRESFRLLQTGGIFRIALPKFRQTFEAYVKRDRSYFDTVIPWMESRGKATTYIMELVDDAVHQETGTPDRHRCCYDEEMTLGILRTIGFRDVQEDVFQAGMDVDHEFRRQYSFYVQAVK